MKLYHAINGCKNSNSTWYLRDFFGTDVVLRDGKAICKLCFEKYVEQPDDMKKNEESKDETRP